MRYVILVTSGSTSTYTFSCKVLTPLKFPHIKTLDFQSIFSYIAPGRREIKIYSRLIGSLSREIQQRNFKLNAFPFKPAFYNVLVPSSSKNLYLRIKYIILNLENGEVLFLIFPQGMHVRNTITRVIPTF